MSAGNKISLDSISEACCNKILQKAPTLYSGEARYEKGVYRKYDR